MSEDLSKEKPEDTKEVKLTASDKQSSTETEETLLPDSLENNPTSIAESETPTESEDEIENSEKMEKVLARVIEQQFSGPIPPPNIIAGYENVVPGAADRIIKMAELQSAHRQRMELLEIQSEARDSLLGVIFAFMLGISCITACIIMVIKVPAAAGVICGSILGVTGIASIVTAFLKNTRRSDK